MVSNQTITLILETPQPYRFDLFYDIHARYPRRALFALNDGHYMRHMRFSDNHLYAVDISVGADGQLRAVVHDAKDEAYHRQQLRHLLGLDADAEAFYTFAQATPALWYVVEPLFGLPLYRSENLYEALIFVIIEQHISWVSAQRAQQTLVNLGYEKRAVLMSPEELANKTIDDLKPLKITFRRMNLLISIAQQIVDGTLPVSEWQDLAPDDLYDKLLAIKGVGHWTASVVVARATGQYRFVPHNDVALQAAVARYFDTEKSPDATKAVFEAFGERAGLAAHFTLMRWVLDEYPVRDSAEF
ncbi:MAG: hypothetical protein AAFR67_09540 [Chloroflexota bacterium]